MPTELKLALVTELVRWMPELVSALALAIIGWLGHGAAMKHAARKAVEGVDQEVPGFSENERERLARRRVGKTLAGKLSDETGRFVAVRRAKEKLAKKAKP